MGRFKAAAKHLNESKFNYLHKQLMTGVTWLLLFFSSVQFQLQITTICLYLSIPFDVLHLWHLIVRHKLCAVIFQVVEWELAKMVFEFIDFSLLSVFAHCLRYLLIDTQSRINCSTLMNGFVVKIIIIIILGEHKVINLRGVDEIV